MADLFAFLDKNGIKKKILHYGKGDHPDYDDGTKLFFHYKTSKIDEEKTVLDDSRNHDKPLELILGKKFKLEVWEVCLKTMKENEVSEFLVDQKHLDQYPVLAKNLRKIFSKDKGVAQEEEKGHCCGMMGLAEKGIGYPDLDELMKNPQPLLFTLEIVKLERPGSFEKETWTLSEDEKRLRVPKFKEEGNALFKEKKYVEAAEKYSEAIGILEQLLTNEKPNDPSWHELETQKMPLLLNFSACKLSLGEYYPTIEHTSTVLKREPDNVKALYRRAKAHVGAWNPEEAKQDFARVIELDPKLTSAVTKELKSLEELQKQKDLGDKEKLKGLFSSS